jgi:isopenicillin N synthase-like dioxygenase
MQQRYEASLHSFGSNLTPHLENNTWNRGYEVIRSQMLEIGTEPELKEGFYIGEDLLKTHPYFIEKKLNSGPNIWPENMSNAATFKETTMKYYQAVHELAKDVLVVLALSLDLPETYFDSFATDAVATMRLLHYPPQPADSNSKLARGIGAHTDFGAVTLLLQDEVDGLQVWEKKTESWLDVAPTKGAYVVNLGNMFMRW